MDPRKPKVGIVVEILSEKRHLGKVGEDGLECWLPPVCGHITHCIVMPKGRVFDNIGGLEFQMNADRGDECGNVFYLPWSVILEVRTLRGHIIYRNFNLCLKCRRITMYQERCRHCGSLLGKKERR